MSVTNPTDHRFSPFVTLTRTVLFGIAVAAVCLVGRRTASAQLDTRSLIGYAATEIGPKTQDVDQAITRFKNRDIEGAREFLVRAKKRNPELPPADAMLAKLYFAAKQMTACRAALERTVRDYPNDPEAYVFLGDLANAEGSFTAAKMLYLRAADAIKNLADGVKRKGNYRLRTLNGLATIAERSEDWPTALRYLTDLAKADPNSSSTWERLGRALFKQQDYERAFKAFQKARQADPKRPYPDVLMAQLYQLQGKTAEAKKHFEKALANDGKTAATRLAYARWLVNQGQPDKARAQLDMVVKLDPKEVNALLLAGLAAMMEKDYPAAEGYLEKAHLLAPTNTNIISHLALALFAQKDQAKRQLAAAFATLGARQNPQDGNAGVTLGWILFRLGRGREAEQRLNAALKTRSLSADGRYLVAQVFFERGQNGPAAQLLSSALKMPGFFLYRQEAQKLLEKVKK